MSDPVKPTTEASGPLIEGATITVKTKEALGRAAPWLKFIGVVSYIGLGLLVLVGIGSLIFAAVARGELEDRLGGWVLGLAGFLYLVIAVVFFFPVRFLMRMAKASKLFGHEASAVSLEALATNLRALTKFYGVVTIVVLAIYALLLIGLAVFFLFLGSVFGGK